MIAMGAPAPAPAMRCPSRDDNPSSTRRPVDQLPAVDDRLVVPEERHEIVGGKLLFVPPAGEPHGTSHFDLSNLLGSRVAPAYRGAVDMLTRTTQTDDHAPDASVYPKERDPETGGRKLEELAFEIVSAQAMSVPTIKARNYVRRGVRRVFCVNIGRRRVLEWSSAKDGWEEMSLDASIVDACFVAPLPVRALIDAALVDDTVAEGLLAKRNRVIERALAASEERGEARGQARGLLRLLAARKIAVSDAAKARILGCSSPELLDQWMERAAVAARVDDIFG
jgi:Uma2 family endonuclease